MTRRSIGARGAIRAWASSAQRSPKVALKSSTTNSGRPAATQPGKDLPAPQLEGATIPLGKLLFGLGIRHVGERVAEVLRDVLQRPDVEMRGGIEAGHLLPLPRTYEAVDALVRNITRTQDGLPVPFAVENVAALFDWPDDELTGNRTGNISVTRDRKFVAWLDCATDESGEIFNEVDDG